MDISDEEVLVVREINAELLSKMRERIREKARKYKRDNLITHPEVNVKALQRRRDNRKYGYISRICENITGKPYEIHHPREKGEEGVLMLLPKDYHYKKFTREGL